MKDTEKQLNDIIYNVDLSEKQSDRLQKDIENLINQTLETQALALEGMKFVRSENTAAEVCNEALQQAADHLRAQKINQGEPLSTYQWNDDVKAAAKKVGENLIDKEQV